MVLSNDVDVLGVTAENRMLTVAGSTTALADHEARREELRKMQVPIPITIVRSYLSEFEDDSVRRLTLRYTGADVVPNGWRDGPVSNGIRVVYGDVSGSDWHTMRTTGPLRVSADKAARVLVTPEMVPRFDELTREVRVLEKLSEATEVRLASCKSVMFTSARDFLVATTVRRESDGRIIIATRSVDHPAGHQSGFVRALSMISGYVLTPDPSDPNKCELAVIAHMNLGGNVPAMVLRFAGLSAPIKLVEKVQDLVLQV
ncbi:hypothetical protein ATCC90586_004054 [Pythium insidiosum]|nr:hypothetical protein ATCC90586_004054 [Pythium insidiosum]